MHLNIGLKLCCSCHSVKAVTFTQSWRWPSSWRWTAFSNQAYSGSWAGQSSIVSRSGSHSDGHSHYVNGTQSYIGTNEDTVITNQFQCKSKLPDPKVKRCHIEMSKVKAKQLQLTMSQTHPYYNYHHYGCGKTAKDSNIRCSSSLASPDQQLPSSTITSKNAENDEHNRSSGDGDTKKRSIWSKWTGKNSWKAGLLFLGLTFGGCGGVLVYTWGAPERDQDGELIEDAYTNKNVVVGYFQRAWYAVKDFFQMVRDPTSEKLLPDPLVHPYIQPPYTVVLEISGLLLKPEWDLKMGWRFKKRPGLDFFLQSCAQSGFEIVVFTIEPTSVGFPLTVSMDSSSVIWYRLFKEDTRYTGGMHIKDLNCLNRDLSKVILLDVAKQHYKLNPRNGLTLNKWTGDENDRELYDLASFLQTIATNKVEDVRSVLQYYGGFEDPMAKFRENQAALVKNQEELNRLQMEEINRKAQGTKSPFISRRR